MKVKLKDKAKTEDETNSADFECQPAVNKEPFFSEVWEQVMGAHFQE